MLAFALTIAVPSVALAQDNCANASDQTTLTQCADKSFRKADAELNVLYKRMRGRLKDDADTTKLLVATQRAWMSFRDAECNFASSSNSGGSMYPMVGSECREKEARSRIKTFQTYLNCKSEDGLCPLPTK